uniref:Uncharacterized protein n=1 Tax=Marmota marmota marmota TaxID=9994 RepID=A0A8C5ZMN8_MARMA
KKQSRSHRKSQSHKRITESCIPAQVVAAVDVNTVANEVYKYNFPHTQLLAKTIEVSYYSYFIMFIARKTCLKILSNIGFW